MLVIVAIHAIKTKKLIIMLITKNTHTTAHIVNTIPRKMTGVNKVESIPVHLASQQSNLNSCHPE